RAAVAGHVLERAVAAITKQLMTAARRRIEQAAALHEVEIEIAVAIHVEQRDAASHDLRQEKAFSVARSVDEVDTAALGNLIEPRRVRRGRAFLLFRCLVPARRERRADHDGKAAVDWGHRHRSYLLNRRAVSVSDNFDDIKVD